MISHEFTGVSSGNTVLVARAIMRCRREPLVK